MLDELTTALRGTGGINVWPDASKEWKQVWDRRGLPLVFLPSTTSGAGADLSDLDQLRKEAIPKNSVHAKPRVTRSITRLLECVDLDRMIEERSLADYKSELEGKFNKVHDDAKKLLHTAKDLHEALCRITGEFQGHQTESILLSNLNFLCRVVGDSERRLEVLEQEFGETSQSSTFAKAFEQTWIAANRSFGTWMRRLNPLRKWILWGLFFAILAYLFIGILFPSQLVLWLLIALVAGTAVGKHFRLRKKLEDRIRQRLVPFLRLDPRSEPSARTFWNADPPELSIVAMSNASREMDRSHSESNRRSKTPLIAAVSGTALYTAIMIDSGTGVFQLPSYTIYGLNDAADAPCRIVDGAVLWAGPGRMILLHQSEKGSHLQFVNAERVAGLSKTPFMQDCTSLLSTDRTPRTSLISMVHADARLLPRSLVIPFMGEVNGGCEGKEFSGDGTKLFDGSTKMMLSRLKVAFERCHAAKSENYRPPMIDVRGFASQTEFSCSSPQDHDLLNLRLAELRRTRVLEALIPERPRQRDENWRPEHFSLEPATTVRWSSPKEMRRHIMFDDKIDPISRYVEVRILNGGSCVADL